MTAVSLLLEPFLWVLWFALKEESESQAGRRASVISEELCCCVSPPAPVGVKGVSSL